MKNKCYLIYHPETDYLGTYTWPEVLGVIDIFDNGDSFTTYAFEYITLFGWEVVAEL